MEGHDETKVRLLSAAGEVFSRKGFRRGTIRDICALAGANVASVNYHFGGKAGLYRELLKHAFQEDLRRHPPEMGLRDGATPEEQLGAFIHSLFVRTLGKGRPAWHGRLLAKEMVDPTSALDEMVESSVKPQAKRLSAIITALLGPGATPRAVRSCVLSVVGQCHYYSRARPMIERMFPEIGYDEPSIAELAAHVTRFSLAGIRQYREEATHVGA